MTSLKTLTAAIGLTAGLCLTSIGAAGTAAAKDYLLTGVKPDKLVVVDVKARKVAKTYTVPNANPGLVTITPSPDGRIAYTIVNKWESVSGIDIDTGKQVFRAELSSETERVKAMFGMDVAPDGKQLVVYESPVKLNKGDFVVQPTRISFYDAATGKKVRSIPAPRQITILMYAKDGSKLYGLGRALYVIDPKDGKVMKEHKTQGWTRPNMSPPDILSVWSQWGQTGVFSTPYYAVRTDKKPDDPTAYITGVLTLDLKTGAFAVKDVENTDVFYFSSVVSPSNPNHVFGVYNNLTKLDIKAGKPLGRVDLDHSYYAVNISSDGKEVYVGGTMSDIAVYDTATLKKIGSIAMPAGANMAIASIRMVRRAN